MAKEYIEREALLKNLNRFAQDNYCVTINDVIINLPAADVVEVVRCKNCRYWDGYNHSGRCEAPVNGLVRENTSANDFCSYGERKGDVKNDGMDQRKR